MTLRTKTVLSVGLVLLACMALTFVVSSLLITGGIRRSVEKARLEILASRSARAQAALDAALAALASDRTSLADRVSGWARRDDTYAYIDARTAAWRRTNLPDSLCPDLRLSVVALVNTAGRVVDRLAYDLDRRTFGDIPAGVAAALTPGSPLVSHGDAGSTLSGIVLLPEGPMLAAASPIVPRTGSAASRGTFMVGRFLTPSQIAAVGDRAAATVELFLVSAADVPPEVREAAESAAGPAVREGSDGRLAGYAVIDDISGAPALVARVTPRGDDAAPGEVLANASRQASAADLWLGLLLVGSALIVLGTVLLVLETAFLGRTFALTTRLNEIAAAPAPGSRAEAHGDDELARLELAANEALAAVEGAGRKTGEREKALAAAVERSRLALQAAGLLVFDVDVQAGRISFDGAVTRVTGYNLEELASVPLSTWEGMVHPDDRPSAVAAGEQAASAGLSYRIEYRLKRKDGSYVTVEDRGARVPGATVKVVGIVHLVPQRHAAEQAPPAAGPAS